MMLTLISIQQMSGSFLDFVSLVSSMCSTERPPPDGSFLSSGRDTGPRQGTTGEHLAHSAPGATFSSRTSRYHLKWSEDKTVCQADSKSDNMSGRAKT